MIRKQQYIGLTILTLIFSGVAAVVHLHPQPAVIDTPLDSTLLADANHTTRPCRDTIEIILQPFNPNTADSITLVHLGLKPWQAHNLLRYRAKGGRYRKAEDMKRLYGMTDELYTRIEPWIQIDSLQTGKDSITRDTLLYVRVEKKDTILELNSTDTAELQLLRGVGRYMAKRIIRYRNELGGYARIEQVREIEDIASLVTDTILAHMRVTPDSIRPIAVNRYNIEQLMRHPYLSFTQAQALYNYRRRHIRIHSIDEIAELSEFSHQDLLRLSPYLSFEE